MRLPLSPVWLAVLLVLSILGVNIGPVTGAPDDPSDQGPRAAIYGLEDGVRVDGSHRIPVFASVENASAEDWGWEFSWYEGKTLVGEGPELRWRPRHVDWVDLRVAAVSDRGTEVNASVRVKVWYPGETRHPEELATVLVTMALVVTAIALVHLHLYRNRTW